MKLITKMAAEWYHGVSLYVLLLVHLLYSMTVQANCDKWVKFALEDCDGQLAYINWNILSTTDNNYTIACQWFTDYVLCVEPKVHDCKSVLLHIYHNYKEAYSSNPYHCTVPEVPQWLIDVEQQKMHERFDQEDLEDQMLLENFQAWMASNSSTNCLSPAPIVMCFNAALLTIFNGLDGWNHFIRALLDLRWSLS